MLFLYSFDNEGGGGYVFVQKVRLKTSRYNLFKWNYVKYGVRIGKNLHCE